MTRSQTRLDGGRDVDAAHVGPDVRVARVAVTAIFVVNGLLFASWTAHIPHVMRHLGLTDGSLGVTLLGAPAGSITAMVLASHLIPRVGSRLAVQVTLVGYCAAGPIVGLAGSAVGLFAALFLWGAFQATLDVAMNTQAIAVERARGRALMSGLHGSWSVGSFAGAGVGALAVSVGLGLTPQLLVLGAAALLAAGMLTARMLPDAVPDTTDTTDTTDSREGRARSFTASRWSGGMVMLGALAFAGMLPEGAAADWSSVYLSGPLGASGAVIGLGYAAFAMAMLTVRLAGDRLQTRFAPSRVVSALALVATVGFAGALAIDRVPAAIVGFAFLGVGLGSVIPSVISAAGLVPGLHPGTAVATVTASGWVGFVCGPPLIGRLAEATSLPTALCLLPVLTAFVAVGARRSTALR